MTEGVGDGELARTLQEIEYSGRQLGPTLAKLVGLLAVAWSLFQLFIASPLPLAADLVNVKRPIFLAFAFLLCFLMFPISKRLAHKRIPGYDIATALVAAAVAMYIAVMHDELSLRPGRMLSVDLLGFSVPYELLIGIFGVGLLLEATRRSIGLPLVIVALTFLVFTRYGRDLSVVLFFLGGAFLLLGVSQTLRRRYIGAGILGAIALALLLYGGLADDPLAQITHKGRSFVSLVNYQWFEKEAIFGIPIDVAVSFVFLFVLFGALLDKAGAGKYFLDLAFAMVGRYRGGPAKAAILASGMTGAISGSSIANVVTTGTFTIPVMRKTGFPAIKAGAIEVAASTNGQIMPPVMGAAAFVMAEFIGISYFDVIVAAVIPAIVSYVALFYISHLEALKLGLKGLPKSDIPHFWRTFVGGVHYTIPIVILIYLLIVERMTAGSAVFWCILWMILTIVTERCFSPTITRANQLATYFLPLVGFVVLVALGWQVVSHYRLSGGAAAGTALGVGLRLIVEGLIAGARNMVGIGIAIAAAGIIVGAVAASGLSSNLSGLIQDIAGNNILILLLMTAVLALVLGMGLPTTANYIVVAGILAPVLVEIGTAAGYPMPLIAVHLFVFYYGLMADSTPPVCLAAFAASAISRADPLKTGLQSFLYDIRTAVLPLVFIFNTELLLIGVDSWAEGIMVLVVSLLAIFAFSALTQGWFLIRVKLHEGVLLAAICLMLFRPELIKNQVYPPYAAIDVDDFVSGSAEIEPGRTLRLNVTRQTEYGARFRLYSLKTPETGASGQEAFGLTLTQEPDDPTRYAAIVKYGGLAAEAGMQTFQDHVTGIEVEQVNAPSKRWIYPLAFLLIAVLVWSQKTRIRRVRPTP